jgi:uncharacterized protein YbcV (DUF1398 family)
MESRIIAVVEDCTRAAFDNRLNFPQILQRLAAAGVESYLADLRRSLCIYYLPDGRSIEVKAHEAGVPVAARFDPEGVNAAVRQSQANAHTYREFCEKVMAAGCCGYLVSLLGRRALYFGRTGETHVEHFPGGN